MPMPHSIELAALLVAHAPHLIEADKTLGDRVLEQLRCASRARLHNWMRNLDRAHPSAGSPPTAGPAAVAGPDAEHVIQEILQSEVLTRTFAAILSCIDAARGTACTEPFARQLFVDQLQARHRALSYLVGETRLPPARLVALDRHRRKIERWTDTLLGQMASRYNVVSYAFDADRMRDFAASSLIQPYATTVTPVWGFLLAGLELAFSAPQHRPGPSFTGTPITGAVPDDSPEEAAFLQAVLAAVPADAFHDDGPFKSLPLLRIFRSGRLPERAAEVRTPPVPRASNLPGPQPSQQPPAPSPLSFAKLISEQGKRFRRG